ncbi:hypothetical protein M3661_01295 [Paenibacillus sp. MER 180]|uniref:hypothetical protein n=1 Tax=unclassified Paenibacillus TaxID=185978 RepID=UPI0008065393|nr:MULTISPECIES: hypothetical protein [unclassified Paenibacillus]MCM3288767.1 hypothetical protein [Paenibacillus sp. MER 180]OBY79867.1 hypothetical protein BBG47_08930 [Paenibacillus sp. KS1]
MWISIGSIVIAAITFLSESSRMKRQQLSKERWVLLIMLLIAAGFGIILGMKLRIPNPMDWIMMMFKPLRRFL